MKLTSSRILFEPSGSKAATNNHLPLWLAFETWQLHGSTSGTPTLRSFIYRDVGEPTCHPCSTTGMMQDHHFLQLGATWDTFYLRELLCRREEVLSVPRISSFWKRSVSLRFLGVFLCCVFLVCVCFGGCFVSALGRHLAFCFSPVLLQRENSWSTTRRFDDRPSLELARHELKKKTFGCGFFCPYPIQGVHPKISSDRRGKHFLAFWVQGIPQGHLPSSWVLDCHRIRLWSLWILLVFACFCEFVAVQLR